MEGVTKRIPHCIPKNRRTSGVPAPSSSISTASSSSLATPPPPPLREILPAPPAPGKAPIILSPLASTSSSTFTTKVNGMEPKLLSSVPAAVKSHDVAASTPSFSAFPSAARKEESSMVVRRAAASAARKVLKQVAQEDSDASDMDISDSDDELTPFSNTRESTADPKSSESSRDSAGLYGRESATREDTKPILQAIPLDLANIRKSAPAVMPPRKSERLFGLEHCPIYYPTEAEFAQPLEYIERIAKQARDHGYGICKVVPPKGWQPPFSLDTETFRFGTRMQQLNSMEATARANLNFMEQLTIFHRQQKHSTFTIPIVMKKPLDLWRLRKEVTAAGGYSYVCDHRRWSHVGRQMGFDPDKDHGLTAVLRTAYKTIIQPFEDYRERVKTTLTPEGAKQASSSGSGMSMRTMASTSAQPGSTAAGKVSLASKAVTLDQVHAASAKLNEALNASPATKTISPKVVEHMGGAFAHKEDLPPGEVCEICKTDEDEANILLCDDCDRGYHLGCLSPPLKRVPKEDWICDACIVNRGDDYGFEEGDEHTLSSFHQRATSFRHKWLAEHPVPGLEPEVTTLDAIGENWEREALVEDHVEREFWRLVESPTESVEVEYGADIHTTKWGSAAPTLEKDPKHPYARDGWNLTNLPILPGSVLRYVPSDICGMTVPWAYVGMMFSTFAWHKEDHNTYSVNYSHIGGTKTWYGVPGEDDEKLEAAMRAAAPELFEAQPDLMYQLVTLMSPGRLKEAGVRVSACNQRPNEFVITFPKAYHAGFNHDFNYNEAVNFCLPDWLHWDLEGVKKYKSISKTPVFSHDELLMTIYSYEDAPTSSRWLLPLFEEMISRELQERETARSSIPDLEVIIEDEQQDDEQYQCVIDKSFCYLSQITTEGHAQVACVNHWSQLPTGKKIMKIRYSDRDLKAMLLRVQKRATADTAEPVATAEKRKVLGDAMAAAVAELSAAKRAKSNLSSLDNGPAHVGNQASGAAVVDTGLCAA